MIKTGTELIMPTRANWNEIGIAMETLNDAGLFPAIGYDESGWEAWVYLEKPKMGTLGKHLKAYGSTPNEAMDNLLKQVEMAGAEIASIKTTSQPIEQERQSTPVVQCDPKRAWLTGLKTIQLT